MAARQFLQIRVLREADGGDGNTIQGFFSSDLYFIWKIIFYQFFFMYVRMRVCIYVYMYLYKQMCIDGWMDEWMGISLRFTNI